MKNNSHKLFTRRHYDWFADLLNGMYSQTKETETVLMIDNFAVILTSALREHSNFNEDQFRERMNRK